MDQEQDAEDKKKGTKTNDGTDTDWQGNEIAKHQERTHTRDTDLENTSKNLDSIDDAGKDVLNTVTDNKSMESITEEIQANNLDTNSQVDSQNEDKTNQKKRLNRKYKAQWTPGTYANIHKGTTTKHKPSKSKTQGKVIMQLHHDKKQLKENSQQ